MIRAVLFDLDGTLTLPGSLDFPLFRARIGCPAHQPVLEYIQALPPGERERALTALHRFEWEGAQRSRPNIGAESLLAALKARNIPFGVLTRNAFSSALRALACLSSVSPADFRVIVTRDHAPPKPHPAGVLLAAARLGVPPGRILVVGDFRFDILAGRRAGACTAFLTNGKPFSWLPQDPVPHFVLRHLHEVHTILERPALSSAPPVS